MRMLRKILVAIGFIPILFYQQVFGKYLIVTFTGIWRYYANANCSLILPADRYVKLLYDLGESDLWYRIQTDAFRRHMDKQYGFSFHVAQYGDERILLFKSEELKNWFILQHL